MHRPVEFDEFGVVGSIFFADLRGRSQGALNCARAVVQMCSLFPGVISSSQLAPNLSAGRFTWLHARIAYQDQFQSQIPWCSATIEAFAE